MKKNLFLLLGIFCFLIGIIATFQLVNNYQYKQAKELLKSMVIKSEELSKKEAIRFWKDVSDLSFESSVTKDILQKQATKIEIGRAHV